MIARENPLHYLGCLINYTEIDWAEVLIMASRVVACVFCLAKIFYIQVIHFPIK